MWSHFDDAKTSRAAAFFFYFNHWMSLAVWHSGKSGNALASISAVALR